MTGIPSTYSDAFHEYARLMVQLHREMSHGDPDGPGADAIRDRMDAPWYAMSQEEQELSGGLSEDLYMVGAEGAPNCESSIDSISIVRQLMESRDFAEVIAKIRRIQSKLPSDFAAHCRGVCWAEWGQFDAARTFFDDALRLAPDSPLHQAMRLALALQTREFDTVTDLAKQVVKLANHVQPVCYATIVLGIQGSTTAFQGIDCAELNKMAIKGANRALKLSKTRPIGDELRHDLSTAIAWGAIAYDQLGDTAQASKMCDQALKFDPRSEIAKRLRLSLPGDASRTSDSAVGAEPVDAHSLPVSFASTAATMLTPA